MIQRALDFIRDHVRQTGRFPSNVEITAGVGCFPWEVSRTLSKLVDKGLIRRTQIAAKGTRHQRKYDYELVAREAAE